MRGAISDGLPFIVMFLFLLVVVGGVLVGSILSEQGQNELARICIESGQQWVNGSCVTKN